MLTDKDNLGLLTSVGDWEWEMQGDITSWEPDGWLESEISVKRAAVHLNETLSGQSHIFQCKMEVISLLNSGSSVSQRKINKG